MSVGLKKKGAPDNGKYEICWHGRALYDLLKPHVTKVVVCNPRKSALLKDGSKGDKIDARKLAELLRGGYVKPVYHGENGLRTLKELSRSYLTISKDLTRVMIEDGPFPVEVHKSTLCAIVRYG